MSSAELLMHISPKQAKQKKKKKTESLKRKHLNHDDDDYLVIPHLNSTWHVDRFECDRNVCKILRTTLESQLLLWEKRKNLMHFSAN